MPFAIKEEPMSKKIFCRPRGKSDILIASPGKEGFTSIKTGEWHNQAIIAYKSTVFTPDTLIQRALNNNITLATPSAEYTLSHADNYKTGARVAHQADERGEIRFALITNGSCD